MIHRMQPRETREAEGGTVEELPHIEESKKGDNRESLSSAGEGEPLTFRLAGVNGIFLGKTLEDEALGE